MTVTQNGTSGLYSLLDFIQQSSSFLLATHHSYIYISSLYHHCAMVIMFHFPDFPLLFLRNVKQGCSFYNFPYFMRPSFLLFIPKPHAPSIISILHIFCIISPFPPCAFLYLHPTVFQPCFHTVYLPLHISSPPHFSLSLSLHSFCLIFSSTSTLHLA